MTGHKEEIVATRAGGLGSSDAKMIMQVGKTGELTNQAKDRIAIMLGLKSKIGFTTPAMDKGNYIENAIYENLKVHYPTVVSNPYYKSDRLSAMFGFDVFNHIDFEYQTDNKIFWWECKATIDDIDTTVSKYKAQLEWHQMLLEEKAKALDKDPILMLCHYDTIEDNGQFDSNRLTILPLKSKSNSKVLLDGLKVISDSLASFVYEAKDEISSDELPVRYQEWMESCGRYLQEIKERETKVEEFKSKMTELMQERNIKSIKNDVFSIVLIPESTSSTFDSTKFSKDHAELYEQYKKQTKRKAYIKINTKL